MRGLSKTPGGKLVGVSLGHADGHWRCRLDGDFFVDAPDDSAADALLHDIETALAACADVHLGPGDRPVDDADMRDAVSRRVALVMRRHPDVQLVGTHAEAIATAYAKALAATGRFATDMSASTPAPQNELPAQRAGRHAADIDYGARWRRLLDGLQVVLDEPRSPAEQMSVDERWARQVAAGSRPATLRFWQWNAPCVVVGRFQSIPDEVREDMARAEGFEVVRRCTGGGAMFIEPDDVITYSLYVPLGFVAGLDAAQSHRLCDYWLVEALRGLDVDVRFSGLNDIASQYGKIGGAAARRFPAPRTRGRRAGGAMLHHVTLAYDIDAVAMGRVLNTSREKMSDKAVKSAVRRVDPLRRQTGLSRAELVAYLMRAAVRPGADWAGS